MYFWHTKKLIDDLKNERLTERNFKNYYLASSVMTFLGLAAVSLDTAQSTQYVFIDLFINISVLFFFLNIIFKANGGNQGTHFINRFVSLLFTISFKIVIGYTFFYIFIIFILSSMYGLTSQGTPDIENWEWIQTSIYLAPQILIYWRIYEAIKKINSECYASK